MFIGECTLRCSVCKLFIQLRWEKPLSAGLKRSHMEKNLSSSIYFDNQYSKPNPRHIKKQKWIGERCSIKSQLLAYTSFVDCLII